MWVFFKERIICQLSKIVVTEKSSAVSKSHIINKSLKLLYTEIYQHILEYVQIVGDEMYFLLCCDKFNFKRLEMLKVMYRYYIHIKVFNLFFFSWVNTDVWIFSKPNFWYKVEQICGDFFSFWITLSWMNCVCVWTYK